MLANFAFQEFYECSGLQSAIIGDSVTTIGEYAFHRCNELKSIDIPDSVTSIGHGAFSWCEGLKSVTFGNSLKMIGIYSFYASPLESATFKNTSGWFYTQNQSATSGTNLYLTGDKSKNAEKLKSDYQKYYWKRK